MKPKKTTAAKKKKATKTVAPKAILPKAGPKAQVQTQVGKTQGQTQRQIVNVILPPQTRTRVPRQVKQAAPVSTQTFYIERSPSQVISSDPFKSGVLQKNKEAQTEKQTTSVSTNVGAVSRLVPGIEEDIKKPKKITILEETPSQTYSTELSTNPPGIPQGPYAPQMGRTLGASTLAQIEAVKGPYAKILYK
jgi:hypothetical protein